jgi:hypothetical protein
VIADRTPSFLEAEDITGIDALVALFAIERNSWRELVATFDAVTLFDDKWRSSAFARWQRLHSEEH